MKTCSSCLVSKPLADFYAHKSYADGYQTQCKACQRAADRARVAARRLVPPTPPASKRCPDCFELKPAADFSSKRTRSDGLAEQCRPCAAHRKRLERYGVDPAWYAAAWDRQGGRCAICPTDLREVGDHVDHDHSTGAARGLLCGHCNRGLGLFRDDVASLRRAIEYLERAW